MACSTVIVLQEIRQHLIRQPISMAFVTLTVRYALCLYPAVSTELCKVHSVGE